VTKTKYGRGLQFRSEAADKSVFNQFIPLLLKIPKMNIKSVRIDKINSPVLADEFRNRASIYARYNYPNHGFCEPLIRRGFHGTTASNATEILSNGFDERLNREGYYGAGFYFSGVLTKADKFTAYNKNVPEWSRNRTILVCDVNLGRPLTTHDEAFSNGAQRIRGHPPPYFDSIVSTNEVTEDTFAVFRGDQILPVYVITYDLLEAVTHGPHARSPFEAFARHDAHTADKTVDRFDEEGLEDNLKTMSLSEPDSGPTSTRIPEYRKINPF